MGTHTYAMLEVSRAAYHEIADKLREAGYGHAFHEERDGGVVLDMQGIALGLGNGTCYVCKGVFPRSRLVMFDADNDICEKCRGKR